MDLLNDGGGEESQLQEGRNVFIVIGKCFISVVNGSLLFNNSLSKLMDKYFVKILCENCSPKYPFLLFSFHSSNNHISQYVQLLYIHCLFT